MSKSVRLLVALTLGLCGWIASPPKPNGYGLITSGVSGLLDSVPRPLGPGMFGFGKPATATQIARQDVDIRPDGLGLPTGSGTATTGAVIFAAKCAACHGTGGVGGPNGSLVITAPTPGKRPEKVIGNYWPYATTVFDYIRRAMPFTQPGSLTNEEVYALTAYLLTANKLLDEKAVLNAQTLPKVIMPAKSLFVPDDRKGGPDIR